MPEVYTFAVLLFWNTPKNIYIVYECKQVYLQEDNKVVSLQLPCQN